MKHLKLLIAILTLLVLTTGFIVRADEYDDLGKQIDELRRALEMSQAATRPLESTLAKLDSDISRIKAKIAELSAAAAQKEVEVAEGEKQLILQQRILESRVRSLYKKNLFNLPALSLQVLFSGDISQTIRQIGYQKSLVNDDKKVIADIVIKVKELEEKKASLDREKIQLAAAKEAIDKEAEFFRKEISGAKNYQQELQGKIAELSSRQKSILAARSGTFTTSLGDVPLADDPNASPEFNPGFSPAFAAFSFGAYTHKKGMSQYGAKGRYEKGQNVEQILAHYFPGTSLKKDYPVMSRITVDGYGDRAFEDEYMKRIYEMPGSWPKEVLKAQAIAARTYAVRVTNNGGSSICATQSCQVYKDANKGGVWEEAVAETRGWVLVDGSGNPASGFYSSTTGGYLLDSGWDTECGNSGCWTGGAYEKIAGSPWFYKGWYTESYTNTSGKCNRNHPWLNQEEFADILNAWVVRQKGSAEDVARVLPVTINNCSIGSISGSGSPFSLAEMRDKASALDGSAYTTISAVSVSYANSGETATVKLQTNRGEVNLSGSDFKTIFNLRAPGYISIRSSLFNIEKK